MLILSVLGDWIRVACILVFDYYDYPDSRFRTLKPKISRMHVLILKQISYSAFIRAFLLTNDRKIFKIKIIKKLRIFISFRWRPELTADVWICKGNCGWTFLQSLKVWKFCLWYFLWKVVNKQKHIILNISGPEMTTKKTGK